MKFDSQAFTMSKQRNIAIDIGSIFWQQWQQHRDCLYRCCVKWMGGNPIDAEDALSRAMLKAWEKVQQYAGEIANFKAWLVTLTRNLCVDIHRERSRGANRVEDIEGYASGEEQALVAFEDTPESAVENSERRIVIRRAIDNLPTRLRETFILHFYQELSYPEIAQQQDISYQNVCKRISQARKILQEELRGYFIGEEGTDRDKSVTPTATESEIGEMSEGNGGVEAEAGETVLAVVVEEVEIVGGEEAQEVAGDVQQSEWVMSAGTSEGKLEVKSDRCWWVEAVLIVVNHKFNFANFIKGNQWSSIMLMKSLIKVGTALFFAGIMALGGFCCNAQAMPPNLGENYTLTINYLPVYFSKSEYAFGKVYERNLEHFDTVQEFVRTAAETAGFVGHQIEEQVEEKIEEKVQQKTITKKRGWTTSSINMDKPKVISIDPFNLKLIGNYGVSNTFISMTYHFGPYNNGYIMTMTDHNLNAEIQNYPGGIINAVEYSNIHGNDDDDFDVDINTRMTGCLKIPKTWDARTILGGEGARFIAVRNLHQQGILTNQSKFFTRLDKQRCTNNSDDLVAAIQLNDLWGRWESRFNSQFNINNATLAQYLLKYYQYLKRDDKQAPDRIELLECKDVLNNNINLDLN